MIKRILLILFGTVSVLLLASCGDSNVFDCEAELVTPENELTLDGEEVLLKGGPLIGGILDIQVVDSFLVVKASTKESQDFLYVYSIGGGDFAGSFVTEGRGENELLMPVYGNTYRDPQGRDMLYLFDLSLCKSFGFDVGQSVAEGKTVLHKLGSMPSSTLYANPISDSLHFARYPQPDCIAGDLFDNNGTVIEKTAVYPALSGYDYFDMLTSADAVFPGSKTIAMAMLKLPQVNILNTETGERHTVAVNESYRKWKKIINYEVQPLYYYYMGATASERNLFALYYEVPITDWAKGDFTASLHIFDIDGNFIRAAAFDEQIKAITYDTRTGILYGADQNDRIFRYDLSDLFRSATLQ